ncbi:hypothetical protein G7Y89_g5148 [Cudoniella acicularis]|uniref:Dienelactone hydrolase domain-containing protein n=1 Tax=Cudoniella acicularis TaxID=354080 RepID=A0A8H4RQ97_9HELO|nr:hypothetical protein G7Y89_g5148 [Cudoniella acicularis]
MFGRDEQLGEVKYDYSRIQKEDAYIAEPFGNNVHKERAIILLTDDGGLWYSSCMLLFKADQFAGAGYLTVVPNYQGKIRRKNSSQVEDITDRDRQRIIHDALLYIRYERHIDKIGAVGYKDGAQWVLQLLGKGLPNFQKKNNNSTVDAGFIADPWYCNTHNAASQLWPKLEKPINISVRDEDINFGTESSQNLLGEGFLHRRAVKTQAEVFAKKQAFIQAIIWMEEHLA